MGQGVLSPLRQNEEEKEFKGSKGALAVNTERDETVNCLNRKTKNNRGNFSKPPCRVVNSLPNSCRAGHFVGRELRSK